MVIVQLKEELTFFNVGGDEFFLSHWGRESRSFLFGFFPWIFKENVD
jgi:hypothetical protein